VERFAGQAASAGTRNHRLGAVRALYRWARRKGLVEADPTATLAKEPTVERDAELCALIRGFDATRYGRAVRLLALTGLRRDEVLGARWSWLDPRPASSRFHPRPKRRVALAVSLAALHSHPTHCVC
jgi:integrase